MRFVVFALGVMVSTSASAAGFFMPGTQHHGRAFWLNDQTWPDPQAHPPKQPKAKFTTTYLDGVASRFGVGGDHAELFGQKLGGASGPAIGATVDHGAPMLTLRWNSGE
jgi:hypothetical protein